jgi:hypothetical protein
MFTHLPDHGPHPRTAARQAAAQLRRLAAVLVAVTCGLLASAAIVPAAFAMVVPHPGLPAYAPPVPATLGRVVITGGMAGWQIIVIALGAALVAAIAAVLLDRALAARRAASATAA